jgi:hypothetical protein
VGFGFHFLALHAGSVLVSGRGNTVTAVSRSPRAGTCSLLRRIFGSIMSKIFGASETAPTRVQPVSGSASASGADATTTTAVAGQSVDVEAVLTDLASKSSQQLNWRTSIVDLMKLLELDSSLNARSELAQELHYSGHMNDSASMNLWLHKQVMQKLAENGGKVPDELKS